MDNPACVGVQDPRREGQANLSSSAGHRVQAEPAASGVQDVVAVDVEMDAGPRPQGVQLGRAPAELARQDLFVLAGPADSCSLGIGPEDRSARFPCRVQQLRFFFTQFGNAE